MGRTFVLSSENALTEEAFYFPTSTQWYFTLTTFMNKWFFSSLRKYLFF